MASTFFGWFRSTFSMSSRNLPLKLVGWLVPFGWFGNNPVPALSLIVWFRLVLLYVPFLVLTIVDDFRCELLHVI